MATPDESLKRTWRFRLNDATTLEVSSPPLATEKQIRRRGRWSLILGTLIAAVAFCTVAYASEVDVSVVDVTVPSNSVALAPGGSGSITINASVTGNQAGTATFEVYRNWTLAGGTFTGSNPIEWTVPPRSGGAPPTTFSTTGTVNIATGQADGAFTLAVGAFDITNSNTTGAKLAAGDASNYAVTVETPAPSDTTPPAITPNVSGTLGSNGWYTSDVTVTWTVTENESPSSLVKTGCGDQNITADQQATTYSCSATSDGGSAGPVSVTIQRDATNPNVSVIGFTDGQVFVKGVDTLPPAGCSRSDATSGIDASGSTGPTVTAGGLTVNGVGSVTYTCYAKDNAGNLANASATYQVNYGGLSGILQPINSDNSSVFSRGKAVPVKFQLAGDEYTGFNFSGWTLKQQQTGCTIDGDPVGGELEPVVENPSNSFRYDAAADQYIYNANFKSMAVGSCWKVVVTLDSGQKLNSAVFKLQK